MTSVSTPGDRTTGRDPTLVFASTLAGIAVLRLLTPHAPELFFDIDPAAAPGPFPAIGPGTSLLLDALLLVVAGLALGHERRRGGGLDPWLLLLLAIPLPAVLLHARGDILQAWRGIDWFAAAAGGVALAHLVRDPRARRAVVTIVVAGIAAMGVRGGWQVLVEHADTVAYFDAHRDEVFAARGWAEESPAARAYERRLRQPEATGWLGFSNVFSGLAAAGSILLVGTLFALRGRRPNSESGGPALLGICGVGLAMLVGLNGSKGAIVAAGFGVALLGLVLALPSSGGGWRPTVLARWVIGSGVVALVAVMIRGLMAEDLLGDRSLLFRWHYLQGATSMLGSHPLLGVGPDGFQDAYALHKPPRSPEAVASAHGQVVDWVASLGPVGIAWAGLMAVMLLRRGDEVEAVASETEPRLTRLLVAVGGAALVLGSQAMVESPIDGQALASRFAAAAFGGLVGLILASMLDALDGRTIRCLALCGVIVIVVQGQIEMLFWQPGSMFACWALVAAAGAAGAAGRRTGVVSRLAGPLLLAVAAFAFLVGFGERRTADRVEAVISPLFGTAATPPGVDRDLRRAVAVELADLAEDGLERDDRIIRGAIGQLMLAGSEDDVLEAVRLGTRWREARPGPVSTSAQASVVLVAWRQGLVAPSDALAALDAAIASDPGEPLRRLDRAEVLVTLGRFDEAADALAEAERLDGNRELDPVVRFGLRDLDRLDRLREDVDRAGTDQSSRP